MVGKILYESFVFEKNSMSSRISSKQWQKFFQHLKLWNIIMPCLIINDSELLCSAVEALNNLIHKNEIYEEVNQADFDCLYKNRKASLILFFLISQINIEINAFKSNSNHDRLLMLIRSCHNLPRCMIDDEMYVSESWCILYSLDNMSDDIRRIAESLLTV